jgi:hypothetical protein
MFAHRISIYLSKRILPRVTRLSMSGGAWGVIPDGHSQAREIRAVPTFKASENDGTLNHQRSQGQAESLCPLQGVLPPVLAL